MAQPRDRNRSPSVDETSTPAIRCSQQIPRGSLVEIRDALEREDRVTVRQLSERWDISQIEVCRWLVAQGVSRLAQIRAEEASEQAGFDLAMKIGEEPEKTEP